MSTATYMERRISLTCALVIVLLRLTDTQDAESDTAWNCCEGDVLFLLDSSGSISSYEFSRTLGFLSELLRPFALGPDQVRVALLQVGTRPHLEFGFRAHSTQRGLQEALQRTRQVQGDTNTEAALKLAQEQVLREGGEGGARAGLPRVLVWLTDGMQPGAVEGPMAELREEGVAVLTVSTGHGNYQVLRKVVTPPVDSHLYFVDIDDINIIANDLRDAIIEIIRAERLQVRDVTSRSAVLQWRPVLSSGTGYYDIRFGPDRTGGGAGGDHGRPSDGTSTSTGGGQWRKLSRPGDSNFAALNDLKPDTAYRATLTPESNLDYVKPLSVSFTTLSEVLSPAVVTVSESGLDRVRVSWGPLQPDSVQRYQVEYGAIPAGKVRVTTVGRDQNSTLLTQLEPDTQYLVTVSAFHASGQERAMSVRACTQEELPALADLQLNTVGSDSVRVQWKGKAGGLKGYWVTWEGDGGSSGAPSSRYLPPGSLSTLLTDLPSSTRVCVSPVYRTARGEGLCCTARFHSDAEPRGDRFLRRA
ncbi:von Willebrand factor A domain-containing protein 1 [Anguilla rostrata]|uniref:von Willebrand factor A domain-containing protein 1 n=1 Tax=Anguilla rostrata TaxID=7938 RepID=UPI0030D2EE45